MVHLKNTIMKTTEETTLETGTFAELFLENHLSFPFLDRRKSDRRKINTINMKKITVLIPCYNEEKGIGKVIDGVPTEKLTHLGYQTEIIAIDNNSNDRTGKILLEKSTRVVLEKKQGKGNAIKAGFRSISNDTDYVVMLDGDNTYKSEEIPRLIEPLENNFCDVVIGSRLEGKLNGVSLSFSHRLANWIFTFLVRRFYLVNITDTCTGYFAWKKKVIDELIPNLKSDGFAIETEMITKMAKLGYKIFSVPITYDEREGKSKLSPYLDGIKIIWMLIKNLMWSPKKKVIQNSPLYRRYKNYQDAN